MARDIVLLGDKTLSLLARSLNSRLRESRSAWNAVDAGYDTWLIAPLDRRGPLFESATAAWGFVLSPRVLEHVSDLPDRLDATLARLASLDSPPTVLFSNFFADPSGAMPLASALEAHASASRLNDRLLAFRETHAWFHVVDHVGLALQHGIGELHDPRYEATAQLYFSPAGTNLLGTLWFRALRCLERPQKKVCVVDLDDTLWGGVLGEDGPDALQMADFGKGMAYRKFQRSLLELKRNGILLAICSKNNSEEVMAVLRSHPDCLLRPEDFAHIEAGWGLKSEAIEKTAQRLGLGLDSFVFIDDSPMERAQVARALPSVEVLEFPSDPLHLVRMLNEYSGFDSLRQTAEDRARAESYAQEAQRSSLRESAASPEEFYCSLGLRLDVFPARVKQADRLHQLLTKTNQFNLTAERLSAEEFRGLLGDSDYLIVGLRVSDRFGDSGITGLAIIDKHQPAIWIVRNFLLSCRVIGRTVEHAFVAWLLNRAAMAGAERVQFQHVKTGRNQVARDFLEKSGGCASDSGDVWTFMVPQTLPPHFVQIENREAEFA